MCVCLMNILTPPFSSLTFSLIETVNSRLGAFSMHLPSNWLNAAFNGANAPIVAHTEIVESTTLNQKVVFAFGLISLVKTVWKKNLSEKYSKKMIYAKYTCVMQYSVPATKHVKAPSRWTTSTLPSWKLATMSRPRHEIIANAKLNLLAQRGIRTEETLAHSWTCR